MSMTDPIADLLTRIRNAQMAKHKTVDVPASRMKVAIVEHPRRTRATSTTSRSSTPRFSRRFASRSSTGTEESARSPDSSASRRPGRRVYCGKDEIPKVLDGLGLTILSTPKGVLTGKSCRRLGVGGEVLCNVW